MRKYFILAMFLLVVQATYAEVICSVDFDAQREEFRDSSNNKVLIVDKDGDTYIKSPTVNQNTNPPGSLSGYFLVKVGSTSVTAFSDATSYLSKTIQEVSSISSGSSALIVRSGTTNLFKIDDQGNLYAIGKTVYQGSQSGCDADYYWCSGDTATWKDWYCAISSSACAQSNTGVETCYDYSYCSTGDTVRRKERSCSASGTTYSCPQDNDYQTEDCDDKDGTYCKSSTQEHYRNYYCDSANCDSYSESSISTCPSSYYCNVNERRQGTGTCSSNTCQTSHVEYCSTSQGTETCDSSWTANGHTNRRTYRIDGTGCSGGSCTTNTVYPRYCTDYDTRDICTSETTLRMKAYQCSSSSTTCADRGATYTVNCGAASDSASTCSNNKIRHTHYYTCANPFGDGGLCGNYNYEVIDDHCTGNTCCTRDGLSAVCSETGCTNGNSYCNAGAAIDYCTGTYCDGNNKRRKTGCSGGSCTTEFVETCPSSGTFCKNGNIYRYTGCSNGQCTDTLDQTCSGNAGGAGDPCSCGSCSGAVRCEGWLVSPGTGTRQCLSSCS